MPRLSRTSGTAHGAYALLLPDHGAQDRPAPPDGLTFQPLDGHYLVLADMGTRSDWYQNLLAQPRVEVQIGARRFAATAEPVLDPESRRMLAPGIAAQWDRFGPPVRCGGCCVAGCASTTTPSWHALAHAEDLPMVEIVPSGSPVRATPSW